MASSQSVGGSGSAASGSAARAVSGSGDAGVSAPADATTAAVHVAGAASQVAATGGGSGDGDASTARVGNDRATALRAVATYKKVADLASTHSSSTSAKPARVNVLFGQSSGAASTMSRASAHTVVDLLRPAQHADGGDGKADAFGLGATGAAGSKAKASGYAAYDADDSTDATVSAWQAASAAPFYTNPFAVNRSGSVGGARSHVASWVA